MVSSIIAKIHEELISTFGTAKESLSLGRDSRNEGQFYYRVEKEDEFDSLLSYMRDRYTYNKSFDLDGMTYHFYDSRYDNSKKRFYVQCAEDEDAISFRFRPMDGVVYHRSYGKRIIAKIYSSNDDLLDIRIRKSDGMLNLCDRGGLHQFAFTRWVNKCIYNNEMLRAFIVKLMEIYGEIYPVFKDVARTIEKNHFFLLPIYFYEMKECHTPSDIMEKVRHKLLNINYNKYDLNYSYYLTFMAKFFDDKSKELLKRIPQEQILAFVQPKDLLVGLDVERFLEQYYSTFTYEGARPGVNFLAHDYYEMCNDHHEVPKLFRSLAALERAHDQLTEQYKREALEDELKKPLVVPNSRFDILNRVLSHTPMEDFEWIHDTERLYTEGEQQHNCVFSYRFAIRNDKCSIWHLNRHNKSYTIRFEINQWDQFVIAEMRDRFNGSYLQEDYFLVYQIVSSLNAERDKEKEKEKLQDMFGKDVLIM